MTIHLEIDRFMAKQPARFMPDPDALIFLREDNQCYMVDSTGRAIVEMLVKPAHPLSVYPLAGPVYEIWNFGVTAGYEGHGYGARMLRHIIDIVGHTNHLYLTASASNRPKDWALKHNMGILDFYRHFGFECYPYEEETGRVFARMMRRATIRVA
jgi:GNAT superfamily N-acetyltransferase